MKQSAANAERPPARPSMMGKRPSPSSETRVKRVAFNVTETLDRNVELYALRKGLPKNRVFVEALRMLLKADSMEPDREPIVSFSYR